MANHGMLTQAQLSEAMEEAISARDEKRVHQLSSRINWMGHYRRDITEGDSLLVGFMPTPEEQASGAAQDTWLDFCRGALECMVSCGFRALDDSQLLEVIEAQPLLGAALGKIAEDHDLTSDGGESVLHWAVSSGPQLELLDAALSAELDPNAQDENCRTPLHWLWTDSLSGEELRQNPYAWVSATKKLIEAGADPSILDAEGISARQRVEERLGEGVLSRQHREQLEKLLPAAKGPRQKR